ncbi:MAG: methyltransferase domain-containing protein [Candidatus Omnitrophota bacterium]|jgi:SAM-dependent methyltransferase
MEQSVLKLNLGCGNNKLPGWINIDSVREFAPDLLHDISQPLPFDDQSVDEVNADGILEHFDKYSRYNVIYEWARVLRIGGRIQIGVPNFQKILYRYFKFSFYDFVDTIFGENMLASAVYTGHFGNHKWGYSVQSLSEFVQLFGINPVKIERQGLIIRLFGEKRQHITKNEFASLKVYSSANAQGIGSPQMTFAEIDQRIQDFNQSRLPHPN